MALWGISLADEKNALWNTAMGLGVVGGCAAIAWIVRKIAEFVFKPAGPDLTREKENHLRERTMPLGFLVGVAAAFAADMFIPDSRFALVIDPSASKMFKHGVIQILVGLILDRVCKTKTVFTIIGGGAAIAGRFTHYAVFGLGVMGAFVGSYRTP